MSPIAFVEMPAYGHINPTLRLLCELAWRGEHVVYYDVGEFQARVERAGATFGAYAAGVWTSTDICRSQVSGWLLRAAKSVVNNAGCADLLRVNSGWLGELTWGRPRSREVQHVILFAERCLARVDQEGGDSVSLKHDLQTAADTYTPQRCVRIVRRG